MSTTNSKTTYLDSKFSKWLSQNNTLCFRAIIYGILTIIIYGQTIGFGVNLDDFLIYDFLPDLGSFSKDLHQVFHQRYSSNEFRPATVASFLIERELFGKTSPSISHAINIIIYFGIVLLADQLLRLFASPKQKLLITVAIVLFIVHPIHVEVVASIKSRDGLLSMFFGLFAAYLFLLHFRKQKSIWLLLIGVLLFALALVSKIDAIGFVILILFIQFFKSSRKSKIKLLAFCCVIFVVLNMISDAKIAHSNTTDLPESYVSFTENPMVAYSNSILNRISFGAQTMVLYFKQLLAPINLQFYYGFDDIKILNPKSFVSWVFILINLLILGIGIRFRKKNYLLFLSIFSTYIFLAYASNLVNFAAGIIADRYAFLASLWFIVAVSVGINQLVSNEKIKISLASIFIITFTVLSIFRVQAWKSMETLIDSDFKKISNSYEGMRIAAGHYSNLAKEATDSSKQYYLNKTLECTENANRIYPDNSVVHKMAALASYQLGEFEDALSSTNHALQHDNSDVSLYSMAGDISTKQNNFKEAFEYYQKGLQIDPKHSYFIYASSNAIYSSGDTIACIAFNESILEKDSTTFEAWENLGYLFLNKKDSAEARQYFQKAVNFGLEESPILLNK